MADISKITALDGVTYNLKDQQARLPMAGATDRTNGTPGAVPKPVAGDQNKLLQGDGTWTDTINIGRLEGTTVGSYSTAEGDSTTASGTYSHAEGHGTVASGSRSHAEGDRTTAIGDYSHTEGCGTTAIYDCSHAEGLYTTASGPRSHAEGYYTAASGNFSHAEGNHTISNHAGQHVFGEYNVGDPSVASSTDRGNYVEIVGNGTEDTARSNARTLDWSGNEWLAGDLTINGGSSGISVANRVLTPNAAIAIPSSSASYDLPGLTANHVVVAWRFSSSAENSPPCDLTVTTYNGYFTVVKSNGTTSETFRPVFAVPMAVTASTHQE